MTKQANEPRVPSLVFCPVCHYHHETPVCAQLLRATLTWAEWVARHPCPMGVGCECEASRALGRYNGLQMKWEDDYSSPRPDGVVTCTAAARADAANAERNHRKYAEGFADGYLKGHCDGYLNGVAPGAAG